MDIFKDFFVGKIVLAANLHYPENIQRHFGLQNCLRRKSSLSWKYSKTVSPAKLSQIQIIIILKVFKDFFACKFVLCANHHYPENIQRLFCLQKSLTRKSSLSWKYSDFFACKIVLAAKHHYPEKIRKFFACKIGLDANHHYPETIQRFIRLQNCLRRKPSLSWKYSKTFLLAKLSQPQIFLILKIFNDFFACKIVLTANHQNLGNIQRLFRRQNCLSRKSSLSWKYSKTFPPAKLSQPQIFIILKIFKDFFACKVVLNPTHHYPGNIQRLFRLQICLIRKSSLSWKYSKTFSPAKLSQPQIFIILKIFKDFFACKAVLNPTHHYPGNIQRLFRLQICLIRKSSLSWKYSKTFSPAKLSYLQILLILKIFKDPFARKIVFDATHHYPENIQSFSPAKLSSTQIIIILKIFKDFFAGKIVLAANLHYPENIQRLFRLQICLICKSSLSWKYSKTFPPAILS